MQCLSVMMETRWLVMVAVVGERSRGEDGVMRGWVSRGRKRGTEGEGKMKGGTYVVWKRSWTAEGDTRKRVEREDEEGRGAGGASEMC
jgi:hypothetical protein